MFWSLLHSVIEIKNPSGQAKQFGMRKRCTGFVRNRRHSDTSYRLHKRYGAAIFLSSFFSYIWFDKKSTEDCKESILFKKQPRKTNFLFFVSTWLIIILNQTRKVWNQTDW